MHLQGHLMPGGGTHYVASQDSPPWAAQMCREYESASRAMFSPGTIRLHAAFVGPDGPVSDGARRALRCVFDSSEENGLVDAVLAAKGLGDCGLDVVSCLRPEMASCPTDMADLVPVVAMDAATYAAANVPVPNGAEWETLHLVRASVAARIIRASEALIGNEAAADLAYADICGGTFADLAASLAPLNSESIALRERPGLATLLHRVVNVVRLLPPEPLPIADLDMLAERALASVEQFAAHIGYARGASQQAC